MDIRRVQQTGGSSYIITLPKQWIQQLNIKKNDPLQIHVQSDGSLLLSPKMSQDHEQRTKEFNTRSIQKPAYLLQRLIGAYIAGYTTLKIHSPSRISVEERNIIRSFTQLAIGPEVVEETDTSVTLKDLLNPTEMPLDRTLKRMHIIVKGMLEDAIKALETKDTDLANDVNSRDNDVDRLHWLVARQYNILLQNINLSERMNITIEMASTCFLIGRIIERIGDHIVKITEHIPRLLDTNIDERTIHDLLDANRLSLQIFNQSITAFFKKDINASNETIDLLKDLEDRCEKINTLILKRKGSIALSVGYIVESTRRIGEYAEDISENVINYLVAEHPNEEK
jgi:phosphate uptake regulator